MPQFGHLQPSTHYPPPLPTAVARAWLFRVTGRRQGVLLDIQLFG